MSAGGVSRRRVGRRSTATLAVLALIAGALVAMSGVASAGGNMHVDVDKVVVGTAPAGTTFTIHYACSPGGVSGDLTFDASGNPDPPSSNFFNDGNLGSTCTLTETESGGAANVAFHCADDGENAVVREPDQQPGHLRLAH